MGLFQTFWCRNMFGKKKGALTGIVLAAVTAIILLFVGIFTVNIIGDIQSDSDLYDYTYTKDTNTTSLIANSTDVASYNYSLSSLVSIEDEIPDKEISIYVENKSTGVTFNATLNGNSLGTFGVTGVNNITHHTFTDVNFVGDTENNITVGSNAKDNESNVQNITIRYPSDKSTTNFGSIWGELTTSTGTIYSVLILVIIIVALGIAIAVLRGFGGGGGKVAAPSV